MTRVSIIIVTHNSAAFLPACLASVEDQEEIDPEVIAIDNASIDSTPAILRERVSRSTLLQNKHNRGFAAAVNQGLELATGRYVLLLNPDAMLLPSSVASLVRVLETTPDAAGAGPRQWLDATMTWQWSVVPRPPNWRLLLHGTVPFKRAGLGILEKHWEANRALWRGSRPIDVPFLSGASLLVRKQDLDAVGGLDEGYFLFGEDADLCQRLRARRRRLLAVPQAAVVHRGFHSVGMLPKRGRRQLMKSTARYLHTHGDAFTRVLWALIALRRVRRSQKTESPVLGEKPVARTDITIDATSDRVWVELGLERLFLYAAAAELESHTLVLPEQLVEMTRHDTLYLRVAPIDQAGQLGTFTPRCPLR